jgi:hypothetical protein
MRSFQRGRGSGVPEAAGGEGSTGAMTSDLCKKVATHESKRGNRQGIEQERQRNAHK